MNQNANELKVQEDLLLEWADLDESQFDIDELEEKLESNIEEQQEELKGLELDYEKIEDPKSIGETTANVVWEQFINQIGQELGEEFIRENRGLKLDLRDEAHIQTAENFKKGKLANHNYKSIEQLEYNLDRYNNKPHKKFREEFVNPGMNDTLKRAGQLHKEGVETVTDIYTGRQIPTQTKLEDGSNNPKAAQREHVKPSEKIYENPSLQMVNSDQELAKITNDPNNLQGYTTAERNLRKSNNSSNEMDEKDKTKHWEKANEKAEKFIKGKEKEGEERLKQEGLQTKKEEAKLIGGKAIRSILMGLLASLIKEIIGQLIVWFKSGSRKLSTFLDSVKKAIVSFASHLKEQLEMALNTLLTTFATAIFGPVIGLLKKTWIFLKQGYKSIKEAVDFLKNPQNKNMPFAIKVSEVGKIVIVGLTVGASIALGEVISRALGSIPGFPGFIASTIGIFMGALVCGLIGALALNLIDRKVAKKLKETNKSQQIEKGNEILITQQKLINVKEEKLNSTRSRSLNAINERHKDATNSIKASLEQIARNTEQIARNAEEIYAPITEETEIVEKGKEMDSANDEALSSLLADINDLNNK